MFIILEKIRHFWFNSDLRTRKINHNIVYSAFIRGLGILISLMLIPITLGYLNAYEYGIWITLNSILTWISFFDVGLGNGLRNKLTEAIANNDLKLGQIYVSSTFFLMTIIASILCILSLVANYYIDWNSLLNINESIRNLKLIVGVTLISICISFVVRTIGTVYLSYQQPWVNGMLSCLGSLLALIWILILKCTTAPSLLWVAVAYSVSPVIVYLIAYPYTFFRKYSSLRPKIKAIRPHFFKSLGGLGIKFFLLQLAGLVIFATSNFVVSRLFTPAEVAPYNICFKYFHLISMAFGIITTPLWSAITDAYAKKEIQWIKSNMNKMMRICLLLMGISALMIIISQPIFNWWIGKDVNIPYSLCISLAIYTSVNLWATLFCCYSNGTGKLRGQLVSMTIAAGCYIPLAFAFGEIMGVVGIAYAMATVLVIPIIWLSLEYLFSIKKFEANDSLK